MPYNKDLIVFLWFKLVTCSIKKCNLIFGFYLFWDTFWINVLISASSQGIVETIRLNILQMFVHSSFSPMICIQSESHPIFLKNMPYDLVY